MGRTRASKNSSSSPQTAVGAIANNRSHARILSVIVYEPGYHKGLRSLAKLYAIADTGALERRGLPLIPVVEAFLDAGIRLLQLRHKGHFSRGIYDQARECARLCSESDAVFVINDRADIACLLSAGLHIGQDDLSPVDARSVLGPDAILGFSTHRARQLMDAAGEPVSYFAFGPIFATGSKENPEPVVGLAALSTLRPLTAKPLIAIGGITRDNAGLVFAAGADSVAVISDLLPVSGGIHAVRERVQDWMRLVVDVV
ncbi:MAG: thiamine phosphate synthase [Candidatus Solibacter usitatus]|nr:thiamine phosphate synthase [Candidatus Solibacter usitatus]